MVAFDIKLYHRTSYSQLFQLAGYLALFDTSFEIFHGVRIATELDHHNDPKNTR